MAEIMSLVDDISRLRRALADIMDKANQLEPEAQTPFSRWASEVAWKALEDRPDEGDQEEASKAAKG
jgi:hypothetical protein